MTEKTFSELLAEYTAADSLPKAAFLYRLSDLENDDLELFRATLPDMPVEQRRVLFSHLVAASEINFDLNLTNAVMPGLSDADEEVRESAIEALWYQDDLPLMRQLIQMLEQDQSTSVRAKAAEALGRFVFAGEMEVIDPAMANEVEEVLLRIYHEENTPLEVRRRCLESVAFSGRDEITEIIKEAAKDKRVKIRASVLFAMGRNADLNWAPTLLKALDESEPELRFEAARAVGELELAEAVPRLIELTGEDDHEIKSAAIWSLGEIGGEEAQHALLRLADNEDDEDILFILEDALNMAALSVGDFAAFLLASEEDDDFNIVDLEDLGALPEDETDDVY